MNKRHYEHTLPNIRGSLSNTYKGDYIQAKRKETREVFPKNSQGKEINRGYKITF